MRRNGKRSGSEVISAQEIACWAYCPEQWRLEHCLGLDPANRAALDAGKRHHKRKAVAVEFRGHHT